MEPFVTHTGIVMPLARVNVDTDQIIPKQFLKRIERTGFGQFLFYDWRFLPGGEADPDFILNFPGYKGASILVAGRNFGCGSSREHAPWALQDYGFRVVIATSLADIFRTNCYQNGFLPVILEEDHVSTLTARAEASPGYRATVDLQNLTVSDDQGFSASFEMDEFRRHCLLEGLDDIGMTLLNQERIAVYEAQRGLA